MSWRAQLEAELSGLRDWAGQTSLSDVRSGTWMGPLIGRSLDEEHRVGRADLQALHPEVDLDGVADARIATAQRNSMIAGGLTAGAYASVVTAALATGGTGTVLALPAAGAAFVADLYYTSQVQLRLAWELTVLYSAPLDLDDPAAALRLTRTAFGLEDDQEFDDVMARFVPEASRATTRALTTGARLMSGGSVAAVGRYLLARNVAKFAMPAIGVPLCAGVNHFSTGAFGRRAKRLLRGRASAHALADDLDDTALDVGLVLQTVLLLIGADGRLRAAETTLLRDLERHYGVEADALEEIEEDDLLARVARAPRELAALLYQAAIEAVALDGSLHTEEDRVLRRLAEACGVPFDARAVAMAVVRAR